MYIFTRERLLFFLLFISVGVVNKMQAQVSGVVYKDFNMDGAKGTASPNLEVGMSGVVVNATKPDGSSLTVTYTGGGTSTDKSGAYAVTGGTLGQIRLEFVMPDSYTFAAKGASGGTTVMFPSGASQNLAVNYPADYCGVTDPYLVTSCYVGNNASGINDVMVKYPYSASGASHNANHSTIALKDEIGSTWGIGYDRETQNIYTGAFVKRHIPLKDNNGDGKEDIGAIYKIPSSGSPSLWLDVTTLGVDVGMSLMPTIATRALPTPVTTSDLAASHDTDLYPLIGKIGLGDVEISDDNKQLFFVNLFDSKVYTVNLATKTLVGAGITVPNTCTGGNERPFALAFHRGKLYVGAVCDAATSKLDVDMKATVYRLDGTVLTSVLSFPLNYTKGAAFTWGGIYGNKWNPWEDSFTNISGGISPTGLNLVCEPQAMFADIVFDTDESLIMLFNDRLGHQTGTANYQPSTSDTKLYYGLAGGDILRASLVSGVYTLEKNATSGGITTAGAGNGQGPGTPTATGYTSPSGEFYVGDDENSVHEEVVGGGAALLPGRGQVVTQVSDPAQNYFAGGTYWFNNTTGEYDQAYVVFIDPSFGQQPWLFGKANGLGDMELMCNNAPIEIGNRVWDDTDKDGIQDAGETGISGVNVKLYAANGTSLIATATTDAAGNYFFSSAIGTNTPAAIYGLNLSFNTNYQIEFPQSIAAKTITGVNLGTNALLDSDANSSTGKVSFSTGYAGENNHSLDVGYSLCTVPTVGTPIATQATCTGSVANNDAKIDVAGISGGDKYSYGIDSTTFTFASATSFTGATVNITGLANPSVATIYYVRIYNASETCYKTVSVILEPKSCIPICTKPAAGNDQIVCAGTSATLTGTSPSTGTWSAQAGNPIGATLSTTSAGVATVNFPATASGTYKFIYNIGASCEDTMSIVVNEKPIIADGSGTICAGTSVDLTSKITGYASLLNRVWTVSTAGGTAVSTPTSVSPSSTTTYVLVAQNAAGCKDTANVVITVNAKPNAGSDQTLACANATTNTLTTATTLVPVTSGGTFTQIGTTPAVANIAGNAVSGMTVAGTYQFQYTVLGCLDTVSVTVNPCTGCVKPDAGADASVVCQPTSTSKLTAVTSGGTWSVQTGNPSAAAIDANGNITGLSVAGTYKFVYSVTGGGITCTDTAQVVVNEKPIIADGSGTICAGTSVDLTSKITGYASLLNRVWTVSTAGGTAVSTPTSVSPSSTTTYVLVAQNAAGCKDTANVVITVNAKPNAGSDQTLACANATTNTLTTATTLVPVTSGGTFTQIGTTPAVANIAGNAVSGMTVAGTYQFQYTVLGCLDTVSVTVNPCAGCVKPDAGADASAVCQPTSTSKLTAVTSGGTWSVQTGNPSAAAIDANGNITGLSVAGTYKFVYSVTGGGITCTDTAQVVVNAKPTIADDNGTICAGTSVDLTSKITGYASLLNRVWTVSTAGGTAVNTPTSVSPSSTTTYVLVAQNATGCKDTANVVITVNERPNAGSDQSPTCVGNTAITTVTLAATAVAGGAWTQVATNPAGAVVTTPSSATSTVTELMPGVYQFIWTNSASCSDTIQIVIPDCSTICMKPNAGSDLTQCLPKTSANLTDATATTEWIAYTANPAPATIDATTGMIAGMTIAGTYKFILRVKGNASCADTMQVVVSVGDPAFVLCDDGTTSYTLTADAGITNVVWYNMAGIQVGTGSTLLVNSKTPGLEDGSEAFYYTAQDATSCTGESCCPVKFTTEQCCPVVPYCLPIGFKRN